MQVPNPYGFKSPPVHTLRGSLAVPFFLPWVPTIVVRPIEVSSDKLGEIIERRLLRFGLPLHVWTSLGIALIR